MVKKGESYLLAGFHLWRQSKVSTLAAAVAYYSVLSLVPLFAVLLRIGGIVLGDTQAQMQLGIQLHAFTGGTSTVLVDQVLQTIAGKGSLTTDIVTVSVFLIGSTELFYKLQLALNTIWGIPPVGVQYALRHRLLSLVTIMLLGGLLLVSFAAGTLFAVASQWIGTVAPVLASVLFWQRVEILISFFTVTMLFSISYRVLPARTVSWSASWWGALIAGTLFIIGRLGIGWYVATRDFTFYGAAGSFLAFLLWLYFAIQLYLLGAVISAVYDGHRAS